MKRLGAPGVLGVLRNRQYATLWPAMLVSDVGTWMQIAALGIYAAETSGQIRWVGVITTVGYLTTGLLSPFGGTLVDRHDRRIVAGVAVALQALVAAGTGLAFVSGHRSLLLLTVLAGVQGALSAAVTPSMDAMVPDIVSEREISEATSLFQVSWNIGRVIGPVLAVAVLTVSSYHTIFFLNALSFLCVAFVVTRLMPHPLPAKEHSSTVRRIRIGFYALLATPGCRGPLVIAIGEMVLLAPFIALIPAMSQLTLHGSAADTGHLFAAQGVGSALGVIVVASLASIFHEVP